MKWIVSLGTWWFVHKREKEKASLLVLFSNFLRIYG